MHHPRRVVWGVAVVGLFIAINIWGVNGSYEAAAQDITVNCDAQETLAAALDQAAPGTTILISGTCMERVTVTTDRIALDGQGGAIIDGGGATPGPVSEGALTIESAQGVVITGLTVQNGPDGILGRRGAALIVSNTTVQDNADDGIQIDENSMADLADCTALRNADSGILVSRTSSATFRGTITSSENGDDGISVALSSSAFVIPGTIVTANNNAGDGLIVSSASDLLATRTDTNITTFTANNNLGNGIAATVSAGIVLSGAMIEANTNGFDGINIRLNSSAAVQFGAIVSTNQNGDDGISSTGSSDFTVFQNVTITSSDNGDEGLFVFGNANLNVSNFEGGTSTLLLERNTGDGLRVSNSSQAFTSSTTALTVQGGATTGVVVVDGAHLDLTGTTTVSNNGGAGIVVVDVSDADLVGNVQILDNAGSGLFINQNSNVDGQDITIMNSGGAGIFTDFSSLALNRSTITQNTGGDLVLVQGTRADLTEMTFGTFVCDASVLLTGDTDVTCPAEPAAASLY